MNSFKITLAALFFCAVSIGSLPAQETIQDQFETFYSKETNPWQDFRMVKTPGLKEFWAMTSDTLATKDRKIKEGLAKITKLDEELQAANQRITALEAELQESQLLNDSISFIGINMSKTGYGVMVWSIIFSLIAGIAVFYFMFMRSNAVTKKIQKAYNSLESEFAEHRDKSRDSQVKLKRELQTALNTLHENRINL